MSVHEAGSTEDTGQIMPPGLYVIGTPIGNLMDITLRALDVLKRCDLVAAEDTRTTAGMFSRYGIHTPLTSYHQHSGGAKAGSILKSLLEGKRVGLVSEAGTPGVSDPGHELIRLCIEHGIRVIPVPGASAVIALLSAAGLNTSAFVFLGFPPRKTSERLRYFQNLSSETRTSVFYESPNRIRPTLESMLQVMPDRRICIGRELTKLHEEIWRGTIAEAVAEFTERRPRGEFCVAVEGAAPGSTEAVDLEQEYRRLVSEGVDDKTAITQLARLSGRPRREVYAAVLEWKGDR